MKLFLVFLFCLQPLIAAADGFKLPRPTSHIVDSANIISASQEQSINSLLKPLKAENKAEIVIVTLNSLQNIPIEMAAIELADLWKLGTAEDDNGIIILLAKKERRVRIEVGQGLEGFITDAFSKQVIDLKFLPYFKRGQYGAGLVAGTDTITKKINNEPLNFSKPALNNNSSIINLILFLYFLFLFITIVKSFRSKNKNGSGLNQHPGSDYGFRHPNSGGGGFSRGGGSFGGGGGFSGGGASGGW